MPKLHGVTDKGLKRSANQDSFKTRLKDNNVMAVVCDGIGGNKAGDVASSQACKAFDKYFMTHFTKDNMRQWIEDGFYVANYNVYKQSQSDERYAGMGTTMVGFVDDGKKTMVVNCGDSRCYILKDNQLKQITVDHTLVNELVRVKGYDYDLACKLVGRNVISRAVGIMDNPQCDIFEVSDYQYLLICSDGLHGYVDDEVIEDILNEDSSLKEKCQKCVDMANEAGGLDNITVVIYQR